MANTKISGNGGYSWWTRPLFMQAPTNRYFTATTNAKIWRVFQNDSSTYDNLATSPEMDDHNAPSILVRPNKSKKAFYTRHAKSEYVNKAKATSGIAFNDDGNLVFPSYCTYTQVVDYNDKIRVFTRSGNQTWRYARSNDWGATWLDTKRFLDFQSSTGQIYMIASPTPTAGFYHVAVYGHPVNSNFNKIVYGQLNVNTGKISNAAGDIGDIDDVSFLPFGENDLDTAFDYSTGTVNCRLFDTGEAHGNPVVLYATWDDTNSIAPHYYFSYRDSSNVWHQVDVGIDCGASFYSASNYYGGLSIDKNGNNKFYVAYEASSTWYIKEIPINSDMTLGTPVTIDSGSDPLVRPYAVEGGDYVVWQKLFGYNSYNDWTTIEYWTNG